MSEWKRVESSAAKLAANAANAQRSTGPKTPEGKARSAANSRKHGLTGAELVIRPDEQELWGSFLGAYEADLQPVGIVETTVFNTIVHAAWNLRRIRVLEAGLFDGVTDPLADSDLDQKLDRLDRYARRFEASLLRNIRELLTLQTNRSQRASIVPAVRETIPPRANTARAVLAKRTHPAHTHESDVELLLASIERETDVYDARNQSKAARAT